jgi:hypothetical protein
VHFFVIFGLVSWFLRGVAETNPASRLFRCVMESRWRPLLFALPTCALLYLNSSGTIDTSTSFLVAPKTLLVYGAFFGFGWALYQQNDLLASLLHDAWKCLGLGVALLPVNIFSVGRTIALYPVYDPVWHTASIVSSSLVVWLLVFGITGLFLRYCDWSSDRVRYMADASYFMYVAHLPFTIWIPVLLAPLPWPAVVKFAVVLTLTTGILLLSYEWFVRYTFIGAALNGPRVRKDRDLTPAAAAAGA